jgi:hypothetical protein
MKKLFSVVAAVALLSVGASVMAKDLCSAHPKDQWQPQGALEKKLTSDGFTVKHVKVDKGCYEVQGKDASGKEVTHHYDPKTLSLVKGDK